MPKFSLLLPLLFLSFFLILPIPLYLITILNQIIEKYYFPMHYHISELDLLKNSRILIPITKLPFFLKIFHRGIYLHIFISSRY